MTKDFHTRQTELTAAKIEIYEKYLKKYLPKVLMGFKKCFIADLFCGAGRNGKEKGSPLVLLDTALYLLTSDILKKVNPEIYILLNDGDRNNIQNLEKELEGFLHASINIFPRQNKNFEDILPGLIDEIKKSAVSGIPKFFFLDPFTYSNVKMNDIRDLLNLEFSEVLLFLPIFHSFRFAGDSKMKGDHKTREFVEAFTARGIADYEDIDDFMQSMKEKLKAELSLDFVRPLLLDGGKCKNALFLLTKSIDGMLAMNQVALAQSEDGRGVKIKDLGPTLFGTQGTSKFEIFNQKLIAEVKKRKEMTNTEIVKFTIMEEFLPKHAKDILENLYSENKITVWDQFGKAIEKKQQWNIAVKITKDVIFRFNFPVL